MTQVTLEEARLNLPALIEAAVAGEEIIIDGNGTGRVKLVTVTLPVSAQPTTRLPRKPGSARGLIHMSPDFDAPLEDFKD